MFADFCEIRHGVDSKRTLNSFFVFSTNICMKFLNLPSVKQVASASSKLSYVYIVLLLAYSNVASKDLPFCKHNE